MLFLHSNGVGTSRAGAFRSGENRPVDRRRDDEPHLGLLWDASPKVRFAADSPLEEAGFEPSVPLWLGGLDAVENVDVRSGRRRRLRKRRVRGRHRGEAKLL